MDGDLALAHAIGTETLAMDTWMLVRYDPVLRAETQLSLVNPDVLPSNFTLLFYRVLACSEAHLIIIHKPKCLLLNILLY